MIMETLIWLLFIACNNYSLTYPKFMSGQLRLKSGQLKLKSDQLKLRSGQLKLNGGLTHPKLKWQRLR